MQDLLDPFQSKLENKTLYRIKILKFFLRNYHSSHATKKITKKKKGQKSKYIETHVQIF